MSILHMVLCAAPPWGGESHRGALGGRASPRGAGVVATGSRRHDAARFSDAAAFSLEESITAAIKTTGCPAPVPGPITCNRGTYRPSANEIDSAIVKTMRHAIWTKNVSWHANIKGRRAGRRHGARKHGTTHLPERIRGPFISRVQMGVEARVVVHVAQVDRVVDS